MRWTLSGAVRIFACVFLQLVDKFGQFLFRNLLLCFDALSVRRIPEK